MRWRRSGRRLGIGRSRSSTAKEHPNRGGRGGSHLPCGRSLGVLLALLLTGRQANPNDEQIFATRECGVIVSASSRTTLRLTGKGPNCSIIRRWAGSFVQRGQLAGWQCAASAQACTRHNLSFELVPAPEAQREVQAGRPRTGDTKEKARLRLGSRTPAHMRWLLRVRGG